MIPVKGKDKANQKSAQGCNINQNQRGENDDLLHLNRFQFIQKGCMHIFTKKYSTDYTKVFQSVSCAKNIGVLQLIT